MLNLCRSVVRREIRFPTMDGESINLLNQYRAGDQQAAVDLHDRYVHRLIALARSRISGKLARRVDPEDVVQSVYRSFFINAREERYVFEQSGDLWRLLSSMTVNKVLRQVQHHRRRKRSIDQDQSIYGAGNDSGGPIEAIAAGPSPSEVLVMIEELEQIMESLDPLHRRILELRLQDHSSEQIAREVCRSERTVRRVLQKIKETFERRSLESSRA